MKTGKNKVARTKRSSNLSERVERSSGNVFADLGLPNPEARLAKAQLAAAICDIIVRRKMTQAQAASILGIDQPKVSALMRGRLTGFSAERLFRFLNVLGRDIEIAIRPRQRRGAGPGIRIVPAAKAS